MPNLADAAISATLAALAAVLLGKPEQARRFVESGDRNTAFARLIEADRFITETAGLRQAAMTLLRNNAVLDSHGSYHPARTPASFDRAARP